MLARFTLIFCFCALALTAPAQWIGLPPKPDLTPAGHALIVAFETGGERQYNRHPRPEWPGEASGVTVGIGYDCGYNSATVIRSDWRGLEGDERRLAAAASVRGVRAKPFVMALRDILVQWDLALGVFDEVTVTRFWQLARRTYPGFDELRPNAQAALLSLTFNRGGCLVGDRRYELRKIADCVSRKDYAGMALWNRRSIRIWKGTDIYEGMARRREAESRLMETP